eukprot:10817128-Alexandrium_andersonii.AAC.1
MEGAKRHPKKGAACNSQKHSRHSDLLTLGQWTVWDVGRVCGTRGPTDVCAGGQTDGFQASGSDRGPRRSLPKTTFHGDPPSRSPSHPPIEGSRMGASGEERGLSRVGLHGFEMSPCLLYTSDAADDM